MYWGLGGQGTTCQKPFRKVCQVRQLRPDRRTKRGTDSQDSVTSIVFEKQLKTEAGSGQQGGRREGSPRTASVPSPPSWERFRQPCTCVSTHQIAHFTRARSAVRPFSLTDAAPLKTECLIQGPVGQAPAQLSPRPGVRTPVAQSERSGFVCWFVFTLVLSAQSG